MPRRAALAAHLNIWFALLVRELNSRSQRTVAGYAWLVAEPLLHMLVLMAIFGQHAHLIAGSVEFPVFALIGLLSYRVFRQTVDRLTTLMDSYASVMVYPQILPADLVAARFAYESLLSGALALAFGSILLLVYPETLTFPRPWLFLAAVGLLLALSLGLGVLSFVLRRVAPAASKVIVSATRDLYFVSGVFFSLNSLPYWASDILQWNPLVQALELIREGAIQGYESPASLGYLGLCALTALAAAACIYFNHRDEVSGRV